jgi:hypothetical protein
MKHALQYIRDVILFNKDIALPFLIHNVTPPKHFIRNLILFTIAICLPLFLGVGLLAHISTKDLFITAFLTIVISIIGAGFVGWLALKLISRSRNPGK